MEEGRRAIGEDLGRQCPQGGCRSGCGHEGTQGPAREIQCGILRRAPVGWAGSIAVSSPGKERVKHLQPHPLMSHVKLGGATTRLSTRSGEMSMRMIVQRWERSPETSVNILLFAGSRMSVFRLGLSRSEYGRRPRG